MSQHFNYNTKLKKFARELRKNSTKAEIRIWCEVLRNKKMMGFGFLRQRPISMYIADFFCKELMLVIEIDGYSHTLEEVNLKDIEKTEYFTKLGFHVLRFTDDEVMKDIENVRRELEYWIENHPYPLEKGDLIAVLSPFEGGRGMQPL